MFNNNYNKIASAITINYENNIDENVTNLRVHIDESGNVHEMKSIEEVKNYFTHNNSLHSMK